MRTHDCLVPGIWLLLWQIGCLDVSAAQPPGQPPAAPAVAPASSPILRPSASIPDEHRAMIGRAAARLVAMQEQDGSWPYEGVYRVAGRIPVGYRIGGTAIVCIALIDAPLEDRSAADAAIRRGVERILADLEHPLMQLSLDDAYDVRVWGHIYALELFCRLTDAGRYPDLAGTVAARTGWLVKTLLEEQLDDGGWNYASRRRHATFVTAPALQALLAARAAGQEVPDEALQRGTGALIASRGANGAFAYSGTSSVRGGDEQLPGSIARNAACETTLALLGHGDEGRLQRALDGFHEHWDELEKRRRKTGTHEGPYGIAPYYFYYGHYYAAQSISLLPPELREREYARLADALLRTRDDDDTWNDRVFERSRAFGTSLAILTLARPVWTSAATPDR